MKNMRLAIIMLAAVLALPAVGVAAKASAAQAKKSSAAPSMHATKGVVKSMDDTHLVITHSGKDLTFMLNPSTDKAGDLKVGSTVEVRYKTEGNQNIATVVTAGKAKGK
jgi:ABC-type glycerol-3-phosphate transport system substrate-binding protein